MHFNIVLGNSGLPEWRDTDIAIVANLRARNMGTLDIVPKEGPIIHDIPLW